MPEIIVYVIAALKSFTYGDMNIKEWHLHIMNLRIS